MFGRNGVFGCRIRALVELPVDESLKKGMRASAQKTCQSSCALDLVILTQISSRLPAVAAFGPVAARWRSNLVGPHSGSSLLCRRRRHPLHLEYRSHWHDGPPPGQIVATRMRLRRKAVRETSACVPQLISPSWARACSTEGRIVVSGNRYQPPRIMKLTHHPLFASATYFLSSPDSLRVLRIAITSGLIVLRKLRTPGRMPL